MRGSKERTKRMMRSIAVLLRRTTWKCGKIERRVIKYLLNQLKNRGRLGIPIRDMIHKFKLKGKQKSEFLDALRRLEKRRILKLKPLDFT